jgi:hypothetical protein
MSCASRCQLQKARFLHFDTLIECIFRLVIFRKMGKPIVELTARMNSPEADIVMMPQQLWLDLEDQVRNASYGANRMVLESRQASEQVSRSLLDIGIDSTQLVTAIVTAIDIFAETFEREKVELRLAAGLIKSNGSRI